MKVKTPSIHIIAFCSHGSGISGGDRIFMEFARQWAEKLPVTIYLEKEGYEMCKRQKLEMPNIVFRTVDLRFWRRFGFFVNYMARVFYSIKFGLSQRLENYSSTIIYSASEFWMDSIPGYILKLRFPKVTWASTWYQTAPNPLKGFAEGKRSGKYRSRALLYWLSQLPIKPLIEQKADYVLVNNEDEKKRYPELNKRKRVVVVIGAVHVGETEKFKKEHPGIKKVYDAVYHGRFHAQKGVVELIEIWKKVVDEKPSAKLVMVGDGPLMNEVKARIKQEKLEKNVTLLGYLFDGVKKYTTFAQSKIVVHPAFYDSGGMAAADAMAFGLPCVGFDLISYKSYYPYGMIKAEVGNTSAFAKEIIKLLDNEKMQATVGQEAVKMIQNGWSWEKRAKDILDIIKK